MTPRRASVVALAVLLAIAFAIRMFAWHSAPNTIWPDEIFNSLEQSHRLVFGYGIIPWEWRDGIRSWIFPGMLAGVMAATSAVTSSVTAYLAACAAVLTAIALIPMWTTFRSVLAEFGLRAAIVATAIAVVWFELIFFAPKALTEIVGGNCLAGGLLLADGCVRAVRAGSLPRARTVALASVLLAFAVVFRIQLGLAAAVGVVYLLRGLPAPLRWRVVIAAAAVALFAGVIDWVTWGYPFSSFIANIRVQLFEGKSEQWGTAPWHAYFGVFARVWGVWGIAILVLAGLGARLRPVLGVAVIALLALHVPLAHKEYRFVYPVILLVIILAGVGCAWLIRWLETHRTPRIATFAAVAAITLWAGMSLQRSNDFYPRKTLLAIKIYGPDVWHWELNRGKLVAMQLLHDDPSVCGIAVAGTEVLMTGGYTYLHRDIPIYQTRDDIAKLVPLANVYLIVLAPGAEIVRSFRGYELDTCVAEVCVYRRPGPCVAIAGYHINEVLEAHGQ